MSTKSKRQKRDREFFKNDSRVSYSISQENLRNIDKPRRKPNTSFKAKFDGEVCPDCFLAIKIGETVRYNSEGFIKHVAHASKPQTYTICDRCYMAKPCSCEDDY